MHRLVRVLAAALAAALLATACADEPAAVVPTADPFAAVVAARASYAEPVGTLATEVQELQIATRRVRVEGLDGTALTTALADLDRRIADVRVAAVDVEVDPGVGLGPDAEPDEAVLAAMDAWDAAVTAARDLADAAEREATTASGLAGLGARLDDVISVWDQPGSRNEQLQRLAEAAAEADAVAQEAATVAAGDPACLDAADRRVEAATTVAERTRELRDLVERFRGEEFDARRAEYGEDPDGLDPLADLDAAQADCWDAQAPVPALVADVLAAVDRLQEALNPPAREVGS